MAEAHEPLAARDLLAKHGLAEAVLAEAPTLDFTLVAVGRALGLPDGTALALFAIGCTLGWIAHASEQYESAAMIRPRARYVGATPPA